MFSEQWRNLFTNENEMVTNAYIRGKQNVRNYSVYLLVDNNVFSTAEKFTKLCRQSDFATIVGCRTNGEGSGLTPLRVKISDIRYKGKNKTINGIDIRFPIEAPINDFGEIDYEHFYNTIPEIQCKSDEALETALAIISKNKREGCGTLNINSSCFKEITSILNKRRCFMTILREATYGFNTELYNHCTDNCGCNDYYTDDCGCNDYVSDDCGCNDYYS